MPARPATAPNSRAGSIRRGATQGGTGQPTGSQRIPGQNRPAQLPSGHPSSNQIPAPQARADAPRRGQPRSSQPPADRLPQQPGQANRRGWNQQQNRRDSQPLVTRNEPPRPGTGSMPAPGQPGARLPRAGQAAPPRAPQQSSGPHPLAPSAQDTAVSPRIGGTQNGMSPVGPGSRAGMTPVGPGSRAGMTPVSPPSRPGIAPVGPNSRSGTAPVGPGSRSGMNPVAPPSRPGMSPVGRIAAIALAVPAKTTATPDEDHGTAVTAITPAVLAGPERREDIDPTCLTTEMEPISEAIEEKRTIDATLARFSAVHDEMAAEQAERRSKRMKIMPWLAKDDDLEEALTKAGPVSPASAGKLKTLDAPKRLAKAPLTKLQNKGRSMVSAKAAAAGIAVLVLLGSFFGWRAIHGGGGPGGGIQEVAALDENSPAILESAKQYGDSNFLLVGTSSRPGAAASGSQTTDTIMVVHIPVDGSRVAVVSFPPNLQVDRPVCQQWNNQTNQVTGQVPAQTGVKLSSVYATGGPRCVTDTVQQLTGLRINHFVGVDNSGFNALVSSVQGVTLCVKAPVKDAALGTIVGQSGQVDLSGTRALNYVRADQIVGDKQIADLSRITRQQRFLAAMARKTIGQQNLLMNANLLNNFLGTFTKSTFGDNVGVSQLAKLATSLQGLALGRITFVTLPTASTLNAAGEETIQATSSRQLFTAIIDNSALPGETTASQTSTPSTTTKAVTASQVKVQVINGIGDSAPGVATQTANALSPLGYKITEIGGPAPANVTKTIIKYASAQQAQAQLLASSVPSASLQVDPSMGGAIQLIIGPGFDHTVKAPHAGVPSGANNAPSSEAPAGLSYVNAANTSCA
ncbi:MAG TPA: LCP family protein [Pseudonocardiaceae bacterium]|nr:LCP family protein [Pseudonocardiaceae bacterium]